MNIGSISEDLTSEKWISLTPELSKKYLDLGVEIFVNKNYGTHLSFHDNDYKEKGVQILNEIDEVVNIFKQLKLLKWYWHLLNMTAG